METTLLDESTLERLYAEEVDRTFAELLPGFITRFYRGAGATFLVEMLRAHDADTFDAVVREVRPSRRALRRAAGVRRVCPPVAVRGVADPFVLGRFLHDAEWRALSHVDYDIRSQRRVEIYLDCFRIRAWPDEESLRREIRKTLLHEYIHYFESFLLGSEQALRLREQADPAARLDLAWARRKDRRKRVWRFSWVALGAMIPLLIGVSWLDGWWHQLVDVSMVPQPREETLTPIQLRLRLQEIIRFQLPASEVSRWVGRRPLFSTFEPGADVDMSRMWFFRDAEGPGDLLPLITHLGCWAADLEHAMDRSFDCIGWSGAGAALGFVARQRL